MQSQEDTRHDQQAPDEASSAVADPAPKRRGRPPGSKNAKKKTTKKTAKKKTTKKKATKKKAAKKKASGKKASKKKSGKKKVAKKVTATPGVKKATRKKASKKKTSKKKRAKKKAAVRAEGGSPEMDRLMAAVEELRAAVIDLTKSQASKRQSAIGDMRKAARVKIAELEDATVRSLKKLGF